jgi:hypothetical protein
MVLGIEQDIPSVGISVPGQRYSSEISGTIDYVAFVTDPREHGVSVFPTHLIVLRFSVEPFLQTTELLDFQLYCPIGLFFVTEAKQLLLDNVPQAVAKMYASAKYIK